MTGLDLNTVSVDMLAHIHTQLEQGIKQNINYTSFNFNEVLKY